MPDMGIIKDMANDLAHHVYDKVTGKLSAPSAPAKAPASSTTDSNWVDSARKQYQTNQNNQIDKAVADAGG